jgi:hypothetical protein
MNKRVLPVSLLIIAMAFIAGTWAGCTVGFDAMEDDTYACVTADDCLPNYECTPQGKCKRRTIDSGDSPCIDEDGDGYGAPGTVTTRCPGAFPGDPNRFKHDCDDSNPDINPGAAEVCDGIDNNCDNNIDFIPCGNDFDCPADHTDPAGNDLTYRCETSRCVAYPVKQVGATCRQPLQCRNGVQDLVPAECL